MYFFPKELDAAHLGARADGVGQAGVAGRRSKIMGSVSSAGATSFIDAAVAFGAAQRAQEIAAGQLGEVGVAPAAADQFGEQQGIAVDPFEPGGGAWGRRRGRRRCPTWSWPATRGDMIDMVGDQPRPGPAARDWPRPTPRSPSSPAPC